MAIRYHQQSEDIELVNDFTQIKGIGPGIASRLQMAQIMTYSQLAEMTPDGIILAVGNLVGLNADRIIHQKWIEQARGLAKSQKPKKGATPSSNGIRQHYASFTVEFLLDEKNRIRRTRVNQVLEETEDTWTGWDESRLVKFFVEHAGLQLNPEGTLQPQGVLPTPHAPENNGLTGEMAISHLWAVPAKGKKASRLLPHDQPVQISITLDLSRVVVQSDLPLYCRSVIHAKELKTGQHSIIADLDQQVIPTDKIELSFEKGGLAEGIYRIEAVAALSLTHGGPGLSAFLEGGLVQVF